MKKSFFKTLPFVLISLIVLSFYIPSILQGKIPIPADAILGLYHPWRDNAYGGYNAEKFPVKNSLITDPVLQTYPWRLQVISALKEFSIPHWNPYIFSGQPLLANLQSSTFSVFNVFLFFNFKIGWAFQIILIQILSSIFLFLMLQELKFKKLSSFYGSIIISFSGFYIAWGQWGNITATALWLPLIIYSALKLFKKVSVQWFLVLVFSVSQTVLSGHFQTSIYVFISAFVILSFFFVKEKITNSTIAIIASLLGLLISSIQILPTLEFVNLSARSIDQKFDKSKIDWFLPPQHLIQSFAPDFFGNPTTNNYWGVWNYGEFVSYIGIIPLIFAVIAVVSNFKKSLPFTVLLTLSLFLAIKNPISQIPYLQNFSFASSLQPSRAIFMTIFSLIILSVIGFEEIFKTKKIKHIFVSIIFLIVPISLYLFVDKLNIDYENILVAKRNLVLPTLLSILTFAFLIFYYFGFPKKIIILGLFLFTVIDLFRFGWKFAPFTKSNLVYPQAETIKFLEKQPKPYRIMTTSRQLFNTNSPSVYKIETVNGYDPIFLKDYGLLISSLQSEKYNDNVSFNRIIHPEKVTSNFLGLLNVKYVATFDSIHNLNLKLVHQEGKTKIYENENFIPRARFVSQIIKVTNDQDELSQMSKTLDFKNAATSKDRAYFEKSLNSDVKFINYKSNEFELEVRTNKLAPLVTSNVVYPGWRAFINGHEAKINKVNYMFMSIDVPEGVHNIVFKFQPQSFYNGLYASIGGLFLTLAVCAFIWLKKYR